MIVIPVCACGAIVFEAGEASEIYGFAEGDGFCSGEGDSVDEDFVVEDVEATRRDGDGVYEGVDVSGVEDFQGGGGGVGDHFGVLNDDHADLIGGGGSEGDCAKEGEVLALNLISITCSEGGSCGYGRERKDYSGYVQGGVYDLVFVFFDFRGKAEINVADGSPGSFAASHACSAKRAAAGGGAASSEAAGSAKRHFEQMTVNLKTMSHKPIRKIFGRRSTIKGVQGSGSCNVNIQDPRWRKARKSSNFRPRRFF